MVRNVFRKYLRTFLGVQIDDRDSVFDQPIDPAAEVHGFPHDYGANPELADQAAAIPARRQGRHHDFVAVTPLPARLSKRSEEHTSELQSHSDLVCRLLL